MADFTLGLAKMAVEGTLSRALSAIDEENKLKAAAQQNLVFITGEFQMMQSFLKVASKERAGSEVVKTWVRQLRELAFDVEDCVEFVIHLDNNSTWVWRLVPSCMAPHQSRDLDDAVAELKQLKARVEEVSQRNTRYNLITDSGSNPVSQSPAVQPATTSPSTIGILMGLWEVNGKHRGFCNLQKLITNQGNDLQVISLWGSAGSYTEGTQIINKAYCDPEICHKFKTRAWVKLMHPFNLEEFLKNMQTQLLQASSWSCQAVDFKGKTSEDDLMKQLTEQRYLLILEGIPSVVEWDILRKYLPDNNNGSRIVVSTKQIEDAIFFTGEQYRVSVLKEFTDGHYFCAFYNKGSGRRNVMCDLVGLSRRPGVVSVRGTGDDKSTLVKELLDDFRQSNERLNSEGAECTYYGWVDVAHPFILEDFYLSLLQSFFRNSYVDNALNGTESAQDIDYRLQEELSKRHCHVFINDVRSMKEWQSIKSTFASTTDKSHIIVITNDESVATSCVDHEYRALNVNDVALHPSLQIHDFVDELFWRLRHHRVISVCGAGGDTSALLKQVYGGIKHQHVGFKEIEKFEYYGWVDVPCPFTEDEFSLRLFKGLSSDVYEVEEIAEILGRARAKKCFFIINGVQSTEEWELIKPFIVEGKTESRIILIVNKESVHNHFVDHLEANTTVRPLTKASDYYGYGDNKEASQSIFLTNRLNEHYMLMDCQGEENRHMTNSIDGPGVSVLWGIAGVGKSTQMRTLYNLLQGRHTFERYAWVDVAAGPFDLMEFSRLLLLDFLRCDLEAMEAAAIGIMQGQDPIQGCREILRQGQFLDVIDGLQSKYDWDLIETAFLSQPIRKAKIVVITTEESTAKHVVKQQADRMTNLKFLKEDDTYDLFKEIIDPKELASLEEKISKVDLSTLLAKCGGLPKVVSAISKFSGSFLELVNGDFMVKLETDPEFHSLRGLLSWMHSYFDACSDLVKPCIFYLSVFPASSKIRRGRLVRRWIAEAYSRDAPGCTARENAQKRFSELVELSMIQQATNKVICMVNGFFREYIISRPMEDNLVFALDGHCNPNTQRTGQHLTIMADWHMDQTVFESIDFARLRSLTIFGKWYSFFISYKMKRLRVLDLEGMTTLTNKDIKQIFVMLLSLKYISLRGCRKISRLPDTLGGLRQLQTLDVRLTSTVMLPSAIIKLHKLQYIRAGAIVLPDEDWKSASTEDGYEVTSPLPAATSVELEGRHSTISSGGPPTSTELEGSDCSIPEGQQIAQPSPENGVAESPAQARESQDRPMLTVGVASKLSCTSVVPRLPKFLRAVTSSMCGSERKKEAQHHSGGVEFPVGIKTLAALHTVGVVNVNGAGGEAFLKQLKELAQLIKLRVCGINKKNWKLLCSALSDHGHLESLSAQFDEDCLDDSFKPPKTLKSLKLYGPILKFPDTIKDLVNLKKLDLEMTIARPYDINFVFLKEELPRHDILNRLCVKVQGDQKVYLNFDYSFQPRVVKIDCSSKLEVTFGDGLCTCTEVLIIQCSKGSSLLVSGTLGLFSMIYLKTVWLKGSYSKEQQQHLQELVDKQESLLVLKLEPL